MCLQKVFYNMNSKLRLEKYLQQYFNLSTFRKGQREIIEDVLSGKDVLGILPTGSGKSLCYQLPAKLLPGLTIVVSPLISLMIDQVKQLKAQNFKEVVALNSFMSYSEKQHVYNNLSAYKLIYVSPEILQQPMLLQQLKQTSISLFVIDEAHCISQWGHEFRPDYLRLNKLLTYFQHPPVLALSATASKDVQSDIISSLERPQMKKHIYPMDRPNIVFDVKEVENDQEKIEKIQNILSSRHIPTIIYFSSRKETERVAQELAHKLPNHRISYYHGRMEPIDRIHIQQQFMSGQLDIICCTSAFGMGINKHNVRLIIHFHFPSQLESFIQEIGRAGRDGETSVSLLFYCKSDERLPQIFIEHELPSEDQITYVFQQLHMLYSQNKQLPTDEADIENIFNCQDSQWRFLYYQLEKNGIIKNNRIFLHDSMWKNIMRKIKRYRNDRIKLKENKLKRMVNWIHTDECLRQALYKHFQNTFTTPSDACCRSCGFVIDEWKPTQINVDEPDLKLSWKSKLKKLLLIGESHETKRSY